MRQFKLKEKKSFIKILKEPPNQKKKVNWSRRVYLAIFIVALGLFVKRVYKANMIIFANGQIELPKQTVKFSNDIKVLSLGIVEGSEVCMGDTLFSYLIMRDEINQQRLSNKTSVSTDWILREQLATKKKIELNRLIIEQKKQNQNHLKEAIQSKESLLLGGIHEVYNQYSALQDKDIQLTADIKFHTQEIDILKKYLNQLYAQNQAYKAINENELGIYNEVKHFISPLDGVISDVFYKENEMCYKKEEMITIHQMSNASINTYFDPEEIKYLEVGDVVNIEFPDKSKTKGIISKFFVSTYAVPSEFQKKYEPTERNIVAEIVPLNKKDEYSWNSFYKMEVNIQKSRYNLNL